MSGWFPTSAAMPSRSSAWSSTESTRITLSSHLLAEQLQSRPPRRFAIRNCARNAQIDLGAGPSPAPYVQTGADLPGAFADPTQTVVAGAAGFQNVRRDAAAIVANAQPEEPLVKSIFGFDAMRPRMSEGISQPLASDPVDLVSPAWRAPPSRTQSEPSRLAIARRETYGVAGMVRGTADASGQRCAAIALRCRCSRGRESSGRCAWRAVAD